MTCAAPPAGVDRHGDPPRSSRYAVSPDGVNAHRNRGRFSGFGLELHQLAALITDILLDTGVVISATGKFCRIGFGRYFLALSAKAGIHGDNGSRPAPGRRCE
jgi:hypothetical protein